MTQAFAAFGLLALAGPAALAQAGVDPTRPAVDANATASGVETAAQPSGGLQSIIKRKGAKPAAIINGEYVELGGRVGEGRLTAVADDQVVLTAPDGTRDVMVLTPGIEKKLPVKPKPTARTRKAARDAGAQAGQPGGKPTGYPTEHPTEPARKD